MKRLITMACCLLLAVGGYAQQALGQRPNVKSPIINRDGSVTFNFFDPSAQKVSVTGDSRKSSGRRCP